MTQGYPISGRRREDMPILGPDSFLKLVNTMLCDIEQKSPARYREVIENLEKIEYAPAPSPLAIWPSGNASGLFFLVPGQDYPSCLFELLKAVGNNVVGSGLPAEAYADLVLDELGYTQ